MRPALLFLSACYGLDTFPPKDAATADSGGPVHADSDVGPGDDSGEASGNLPPVADAGPDQDVDIGRVVALDGGASSDPDGDALSYRWSLVSKPQGSTATLINGSRVNPQLFVDQPGEYLVSLEVSDGLLSDVDEVLLTAIEPNGTPSANAGADQSVAVGDVVLLNGTGSTDPDGDALNFTWLMLTRPSGSLASLSDPASDRPSFTADRSGTYEVQLVVDDGVLSSAPDVVTVRASEPSSGDDGCLGCAAGGSSGAGGWVALGALALLRRRHPGAFRRPRR